MSWKYILDDDLRPVRCGDIMEWATWFEAPDNGRLVARDERGDVSVSTLFLGLDHSFGYGEPVLYETMVFGGAFDGEQERYHTREQAVAGHAAMVAKVWP